MSGNVDRGITLAKFRAAFDALSRRPPSTFRQLSELTERMHLGADLGMPDVHAPPQHAPAPTAGAGKPPIYKWALIIEPLDAAYCRTFFAENNRAPTWKQRRAALENKLGSQNTPSISQMKRKLRPC